MCSYYKMLAIVFCLCLVISCVLAGESAYSEFCPRIIKRLEWGARGALQIEYSITPIEYVIIHHTVTPTCRNKLECSQLLKSIQNFHMEEMEFHDIGYNFIIGGDANVYEGCGWHKIGAHTKGYNSRSISIAFVGTFTDKLPSDLQLQAAKSLIQCGVEIAELSKRYKLYGARQLSATQSPGLKLYREIIKWPHYTKTI